MTLRRPSLARDCVLLLLLALVPALLSAWLHPRRPEWRWTKPAVEEVTVATVARWPKVLWVDARGEKEYGERHVPGAVLLNETEWERRLPDFLAAWTPERRVVVYCNSASCNASHEVARRLQRELGLTDVRVLRGGWAAWQEGQP